jgi:hypothetical protein
MTLAGNIHLKNNAICPAIASLIEPVELNRCRYSETFPKQRNCVDHLEIRKMSRCLITMVAQNISS